MSRRLLLLLAGLGGAAVAFVLWSGTAYASTSRPLAAPDIPGAVGGALPQAGHQPLAAPLPTPEPPPVARPVVDVVRPVVTHTVARVRTAVPAVAAILPARQATHAPARPASATTRRTTHPPVTAPARRIVRRSSDATNALATRARAHTATHVRHRRRATSSPLGVAGDAPNTTARSSGSSAFAVLQRNDGRAADGWSHAALVVAREPEMVVLRDIARPG